MTQQQGRLAALGTTLAIRVPKAAELIAGDIRRRVATGRLRPGDLLPGEAELMCEFGVSRPVLREALRILECESIITVTRGARGGGRVCTPDGSVIARYLGALLQYQGALLSDVYRARAEIEVAAVGLLAKTDASNLLSLEQMAAEGRERVADERAFADYSLSFHEAVVQLASPTLSALSMALFRIIDAHNVSFIASHPVGYEGAANQAAVQAYSRLARLLSHRDVAAAQQHWRRHLEAVEKFMIGDRPPTVIDVLR